jgi:hypothetical protein
MLDFMKPEAALISHQDGEFLILQNRTFVFDL